MENSKKQLDLLVSDDEKFESIEFYLVLVSVIIAMLGVPIELCIIYITSFNKGGDDFF